MLGQLWESHQPLSPSIPITFAKTKILCNCLIPGLPVTSLSCSEMLSHRASQNLFLALLPHQPLHPLGEGAWGSTSKLVLQLFFGFCVFCRSSTAGKSNPPSSLQWASQMTPFILTQNSRHGHQKVCMT